MTSINIGTSKGNIVGHKIDKEFSDITHDDIRAIVEKKRCGADIWGWCLTPKKKAMLQERTKRLEK